MDFQLNLTAEPITAAYPVEPLIVAPETPLRDIFALMRDEKTGSLIVCRDGVLEGILTERDVLRLMATGLELDRPVEELMIRDPVTIDHNETVGAAIQKMAQGGYRRLPMVDQEHRPQGMIKVSGIVRYLVEHVPQSVYNLPPDPQKGMQEREGA